MFVFSRKNKEKACIIQNKALPLHHKTTTNTNQTPTGRLHRYNNMNTSIYNGLAYHTSEINANLKIKVNGIFNGKKINTLVGVSGLIRIIGDIDLVNKMFKKALNTLEDKLAVKLRRGIKVTFYYY